MYFYDFLIENNIDIGSFGVFVVAGFVVFYILYYIPFLLMSFFTLLLVLFGNWNDIKRDKFLWHRDNYLYRKVEGFYDANGYCVKSIYYKFILNHKLNRKEK